MSIAKEEQADPPTGVRITDMAPDDRPRERLLRVGPANLSNAELLAILLRVGGRGQSALDLAQRILKAVGGVGGLLIAKHHELLAIKGMGAAKVAQLLAGIELGHRAVRARKGTRPQIGSPEEAAELLSPAMAGEEQETVWVLLLDTRNREIEMLQVYRGSLNTSSIRVGELFREAVRRNAAGIIVAHNHPSGDPAPSPEDVAVTRMIIDAGRLLDIKVLDHLVIGHASFVSLKERGLGFVPEGA